LADYTFAEQVEFMRTSWAVVGMHGAAMSFMLFMSPGAVLVEISVSSPLMFKQFSKCAPWVHHHVIHLGGKGVSSKHHAVPKEFTVSASEVTRMLKPYAP